MGPLRSRLLTAAAALAMPVAAGAQAPAMFRGDAAHHAVYRGGGTTIVGVQWRYPTAGDVISSPTVWGDAVYVGSGDGRLYALDRATGRPLWAFDAGAPIASTPAVAEGMVFFGTRTGRYLALDARRGTVRWQLATGPDQPLPWGHESGDVYTSSPAYAQGVLVFGAGDGHVYAVTAATGKVRWRAATGGRVRSSPAVDGGTVVVGSADGDVYAFDLATGRRRWRFATQGASLNSGDFGFDRRTVQSSPAVANGTVFIGARDGFLYALDAATGALRWRVDHHVSWVNSSPAVADGVVYDGSSDAHFEQAVEALSGRELWRTPTEVPVWSSAAVAGTTLCYGDGAGLVHVADRRTGRDLAIFRTGGKVFGSPVVSGALLFVGGTDGAVYALRLGAGAPVRRAVFFDSSYEARSRVANGREIATYLAHRGYEVVDARSVVRFLETRVADRDPSVLVFGMDVLPPALATASPGASPLRRYLDAGGKVVWVGVPPMLWQPDSAGGRDPQLKDMDWSAPTRLLGVPHDAAIFDARGARATATGRRWGLPERWHDRWSVAPSGVTTTLGLDEWGLAAAWVRSYGGPEGTGFVRVPPDDLLAIYVAAEYRPAPASALGPG
jgi:outer membrane protein assembly factor BamB